MRKVMVFHQNKTKKKSLKNLIVPLWILDAFKMSNFANSWFSSCYTIFCSLNVQKVALLKLKNINDAHFKALCTEENIKVAKIVDSEDIKVVSY